MDGDLFGELHAKRMDRRNTTAAAASRQKSCNACVRGKRRCDKTMPRCTRCAAKGLDCVYQKLPPMPSHSSPSSSASSGAPHAATTSVGAPQDPCPDMSTDFDMGGFDMNACDLGVGGTGGTVTSPETLQLDPSLDFHIADLIGSGSHHTSSLWNIPGFAEPKTDFPAPVPMPPPPCDQPRQPIRDLAVLDENSLDNCVVADPLLVHDPRSRIGHIVGYLTNLHVDFAQSRTLPFIHPRLYAAHLPRTMMSAFCAATAYANRTPATKGWALRLLSDAARDIQNEGRSGPQSPVDKVARVQALCLVDTMRIFDGDIALRHAAEKERPLLKEWVKELVKLREELEGEADAPIKASRDRPPKSWDHWVLLESARRTCIMSIAFMCLVFLLKSEVPEQDLWQPDQCFTASRHLWEAATSVDFFRAWREQPQWAITNGVFRELWQYARAEDMDEFTRLMLTTQVGPDAIDHFMQGEATVPVS